MHNENEKILAKPTFILFDWGGTLMQRMPCWLTKKKCWTNEEYIPYSIELLQNLHKTGYRLGLASNASEGDEESIRQCLGDMGQLFERIYTWRSIGSPKPWPPFWHRIIHDLGIAPEQIMMVGDDWMTDVWGAQEAGMSAIWFNQHSNESRTRPRVQTVHHLQDIETLLEL